MDNVLTWVNRLRLWCPVTALSVEVVKFDTQALIHPEIDGVQYQQGTLFGYELKQYLLEKWGRHCAYCQRTDRPLQIEHMVPKSRGGSDRVTNLTLACGPCNQAKGTQTAEEYGFPQLQAQAQRPLRGAAAVNTTRKLLYEQLQATGLPVETGTGGMTQYHRVQRGLPKEHWIDAAVVGPSTPEALSLKGIYPWLITATGRQSRQMCNVDGHGFPRSKPKSRSVVQGFRTGDMVKAVCPACLKSAGTHVGRVVIRARGSFDVTTAHGRVKDIPARYCRSLHHADGYRYHQGVAALPLMAQSQRHPRRYVTPEHIAQFGAFLDHYDRGGKSPSTQGNSTAPMLPRTKQEAYRLLRQLAPAGSIIQVSEPHIFGERDRLLSFAVVCSNERLQDINALASRIFDMPLEEVPERPGVYAARARDTGKHPGGSFVATLSFKLYRRPDALRYRSDTSEARKEEKGILS